MTIRRGALYRVCLTTALIAFVFLASAARVEAASFDASSIISDGEFIDTNSLSVSEVQSFLNDRGGFLASFSEGGRSAAQIIWDAAHGKNDAAGTWNGIVINESTGTVSPKVILVTLQKEQSLLTMKDYNDAALRTAMGYGCPDSGGCNSAYAGFTKQVENAAWQLRYNFERAQGNGFSDYQVGQSFCTSDWNGTNCGSYGNRASASLYRYTPHVYNGNYNFWNLFYNTYFFASSPYSAAFVSQSSYPTIGDGQTTTMTITYRNTGATTWQRGTVNLGTVDTNYQYRLAGYELAHNWVSGNRPAYLNEASVAPGEVGSFTFQLQNPGGLGEGNYRLDVGLVADGITWFNRGTHAYWDVSVPVAYSAAFVSQSGYPTLTDGATTTATIQYRNTGSATWYRGTVNLGTVDTDYRYRLNSYLLAKDWVSGNRPAYLNEASVAPGEVGSFTFQLQNPGGLGEGNYRLDVGLVADGITWFNRGTHAYWDVVAR